MTKHQQMVAKLVKPGENIIKEMTPNDAHIVHMIMGVSGEAGELLDAIKKHVIYRAELDHENVIEEIGDIEFYLEGLRQALGITREECLDNNMKKLAVRYDGHEYTDQSAINRADKNK